jgi:hypothetical protein
MTDFQQAHSRAAAAIKLRGHLYTLEHRWNTHFRLWEQPHDADGRALDPALDARTTRLIERQRAARAAEEEADCQLSELWDRLSRQLPAADVRTEADAYARDTDRNAAGGWFDLLVAQGIFEDPGFRLTDARVVIDLMLLRRLQL